MDENREHEIIRRLAAIETAIESLPKMAATLESVRLVLAGDDMLGKKGLIGNTIRIMEDLDGTPDDKSNGIKRRVARIEGRDNRRTWYITGWASGAGAVAGIGLEFLKDWWTKPK